MGAGKMLVHGYYDATGVTSGNIATGCSAIESVTPGYSTVRASSTIDHTSTPGTIALTGLTAGDTGTFMALCRP